MRRLQLIWLVILLFTLQVPVSSNEVIRTDPNTDGAPPQEHQTDILGQDSRLSQKVSLWVERATVASVIDALSRQSGVTLYSGYNNSDWEARDRKMNVFTREVPLRDLMESIARTMKFKWSRSGEEDQWSYRLYVDRRGMLDIRHQLKEQERLYKQQMLEKRKHIIDTYLSLGDVSDTDIEHLRDESSALYLEMKAGFATPLAELFRTSPALTQALLDGRSETINAASLTAEAQQALMETARGMLNLAQMQEQTKHLDNRQTLPTLPDNLQQLISSATIRTYAIPELDDNFESAMHDSGGMTVTIGDFCNGIKFTDDQNPFQSAWANLQLKCMDENKSLSDIDRSDLAWQAAVQGSQALSRSTPGETPVEHPYDPDLDKKLGTNIDGITLPDTERKLAESTGLAVVSDHFGFTTQGSASLPEQKTIAEALEQTALAFNYNWEKHNSIIELRDRYWFRKRSLLIPEKWLADWRKEFKTTGTLDVESLSKITSLTLEQYFANVKDDPHLDPHGLLMGTTQIYRGPIRLLGHLSKEQRDMLFSPRGWEFTSLSVEDQSRLSPGLFTQWLHKYPEFKLSDNTMIYGTRNPAGKQIKYQLKITAEGYDPLEINFITPKYEEPSNP